MDLVFSSVWNCKTISHSLTMSAVTSAVQVTTLHLTDGNLMPEAYGDVNFIFKIRAYTGLTAPPRTLVQLPTNITLSYLTKFSLELSPRACWRACILNGGYISLATASDPVKIHFFNIESKEITIYPGQHLANLIICPQN